MTAQTHFAKEILQVYSWHNISVYEIKTVPLSSACILFGKEHWLNIYECAILSQEAL